MALVIATTAVNSDEPCYSLKEVEEPAIVGWGLHRYRILKVLPGARLQAGVVVVHPKHLREFRFDMGLASLWPQDLLNLIGGFPREDGQVEILETVGWALDTAGRIYAGYIKPVERPQATDLITAFREQPEIRRKARVGLSSFGFGGALQRS